MLSYYFAFAISPTCSAADNTRWIYRDLGDTSREIVIDSQARTVDLGHVGLSATFCSESSPFVCFATDAVLFAIDKGLLEGNTSWEVDGVQYTVTRHRKELVFGQILDAYYIEGKKVGGETQSYLFTRDRGLLAIFLRDNQHSREFLSIEYCGFGAPPMCSPPRIE